MNEESIVSDKEWACRECCAIMLTGRPLECPFCGGEMGHLECGEEDGENDER